MHDEKAPDSYLAYMLARMEYPGYPVPIGVFRDVTKATYEDMLTAQIRAATEKMVSALVTELGCDSDDGRKSFPDAAVMARRPEKFFRDKIRAVVRDPEVAERLHEWGHEDFTSYVVWAVARDGNDSLIGRSAAVNWPSQVETSLTFGPSSFAAASSVA